MNEKDKKIFAQRYAGLMAKLISELLDAKMTYEDILASNGTDRAAASKEAEQLYEAAWRFVQDQR